MGSTSLSLAANLSNDSETILVVIQSCKEQFPSHNIDTIELAYRTLTDSLYDMGYTFDVSLESFIKNCDTQNLDSYCQQFLDEYQLVTTPITEISAVLEDSTVVAPAPAEPTDIQSGSDAWFYNTGTSLPQEASYDTYSLLSTLHAGDVVVEHNTVASGITGHAAIVEGKFWSSTYDMYYIRVIEAISQGVCRSVMDDERVDEKEAYFYHLTDEDFDASVNAVMWAAGQLGKTYRLYAGSSVSASRTHWYCSELVYASYYNQGVNLIPGTTPGDAILPYSFESSSVLTEIDVS